MLTAEQRKALGFMDPPGFPGDEETRAGLGFAPGDEVEVHAFGHWYQAIVRKLTKKTVTVRYMTGTGKVRDKTVPNPIRPDFSKVAGRVLVRIPHPGDERLWVRDAWRVPAAHAHDHVPVDADQVGNAGWVIHLIEAHGWGLPQLAGRSHAAAEAHAWAHDSGGAPDPHYPPR